MKKRNIFILVILVAVAAGFFWRMAQRIPPALQDGTTSSLQSEQAGTSVRHSGTVPPPGEPSISLTNVHDPHLAELTRKFTEEMRNDPDYMFKVPIRFYGKVVDQNEMPVAGADVGFKWNKVNDTNHQIESGEAGTKTDLQGLFSLENQKGGQLNVTVSKPDYYSTSENPSSFEYAQPYSGSFYTPDPNNPIVFPLRKRGQGVALINSQHGIRPDLELSIPIDGTPLKVDLLQMQAGGVGPLEVSQMKPDPKLWKQAKEWSFQMTIQDGGFVEYHDEFPFEAPSAGYQQMIHLDFQRDQTNWDTFLKKDYFIRFGNPPFYGRLHLETGIQDKAARLTYAINPDGSRNLEPQ